MFNYTQSFLIVVFTVGGSLGFMLLLNRIWPWEKRHVHNDVIGWQLSVLGTTYAVMLGFMLYTVWTDFSAADLNADFEANALVNIYRLAIGLPEPQNTQLRGLTRSYARVVLEQDWPMMANDRVPEQSQQLNQKMWETLVSVRVASPPESTAEDHALSELSSLSERRRTRLLQSASRLPAILWCVLIIGGAVTIASASMFGSENTVLHVLQVFAFSMLISLVLVAIADIDRPFQGSVHVSSVAFERALENVK
ncbi:putative integral membrane protein [Acidisarcina polymorpha]|uniref:Putative integral membrane protein n=1 Tax=Acidisarcina polymorpha TaxID=2211140 RepID=A0A2Z5FVQ9_9BACT|nr:DUF4239 domain-containing protein [Acidisarcina polymorpha]AXC10455.1 putative integral membrane protein [Acidisarcina polymorpha]